MIFSIRSALTTTTLFLILLHHPWCCKVEATFDILSGQAAFVRNIIDRLGISSFYANLFRGARRTFVKPFFPALTSPPSSNEIIDDEFDYEERTLMEITEEETRPVPEKQQIFDFNVKPTTDFNHRHRGLSGNSVNSKNNALYVIKAPNLATSTTTPIPFLPVERVVTASYNVKTLPPLKTVLKYKAVTENPIFYTTARAPKAITFNNRNPAVSVISNYSNVDDPGYYYERPEIIYGQTSTDSDDFYFTTTTSVNEDSERFSVTTFRPDPILKSYFVPRTTFPPRAVVKSLPQKKTTTKPRPVYRRPTAKSPSSFWETTTTLPKLFVSSIPAQKYHKVNPNFVSKIRHPTKVYYKAFVPAEDLDYFGPVPDLLQGEGSDPDVAFANADNSGKVTRKRSPNLSLENLGEFDDDIDNAKRFVSNGGGAHFHRPTFLHNVFIITSNVNPDDVISNGRAKPVLFRKGSDLEKKVEMHVSGKMPWKLRRALARKRKLQKELEALIRLIEDDIKRAQMAPTTSSTTTTTTQRIPVRSLSRRPKAISGFSDPSSVIAVMPSVRKYTPETTMTPTSVPITTATPTTTTRTTTTTTRTVTFTSPEILTIFTTRSSTESLMTPSTTASSTSSTTLATINNSSSIDTTPLMSVIEPTSTISEASGTTTSSLSSTATSSTTTTTTTSIDTTTEIPLLEDFLDTDSVSASNLILADSTASSLNLDDIENESLAALSESDLRKLNLPLRVINRGNSVDGGEVTVLNGNSAVNPSRYVFKFGKHRTVVLNYPHGFLVDD